jgi:hypothetical protein
MYFTLRSIPELQSLLKAERLKAWRRADRDLGPWFVVLDILIILLLGVSFISVRLIVPNHVTAGRACVYSLFILGWGLWVQFKQGRARAVLRKMNDSN